MRNTGKIKNAYKPFGNTMHVDHWFDAECFKPPMIRIAEGQSRIIEIDSRVTKSGKPTWFLPVLQREYRPIERLAMSEKIDSALITAKRTRLPKNYSPRVALEVEKLARKKPNRDWRIEIIEAFISLVYQRQGRNKWVLIEVGKGYA
jgi:hypothetical protein